MKRKSIQDIHNKYFTEVCRGTNLVTSIMVGKYEYSRILYGRFADRKSIFCSVSSRFRNVLSAFDSRSQNSTTYSLQQASYKKRGEARRTLRARRHHVPPSAANPPPSATAARRDRALPDRCRSPPVVPDTVTLIFSACCEFSKPPSVARIAHSDLGGEISSKSLEFATFGIPNFYGRIE